MGVQGYPKAQAGMVIGLLGGSFDPAHEGHAHITREAMKRLGLDRVWWLVTPGNPLKARQPAPMAQRLARAREVMNDPHVVITDIEARLGTRATADTLRRLVALYPGVHFVWIMGADNLVQFHRWSRWRQIMQMVPVAVMARPGAGLAARLSVAARAYRTSEVARPEGLGLRRAPAWSFVNLPLHSASSSAIRARGGWQPPAGVFPKVQMQEEQGDVEH
jgi:nicotinate-nucleotide adenylyltransferase